MNYLQIESFLKTIELGSMTKAANALFISQSTLSDRITKLEEELGFILFSRGHGSKGVVLTERGISFVEYAKKYLALIDDIEDWKIDDFERIEIRIGAPHSVNSFLLQDFYRESTHSNDIKLYITSHWNYNIYTLLDTYELDLGLVSRPFGSKQLKTRKFFREELYIVYNPIYSDYSNIDSEFQLKKSNEIHLDWGPDYEIWHQNFWSGTSKPKISVDSPELLYELLKTNNAWAVMPACVYNYLNEHNENLMKIKGLNNIYRTIFLVTQQEPKDVVKKLINKLEIFIVELEKEGLCKNLL